jgi:diaminopimelate epimerase
MKFSKMHGLGNDFVMVDGFAEQIAEGALPELSRRVCDRHFGIGADGLILALPSDNADFRMRIFNSDGSEANHCGNGVRCLAKFVYELGRTSESTITVETVGRVNVLQLFKRDGRVGSVRVDMGEPLFPRQAIPMSGPETSEAIDETLQVGGHTLELTCLSMGNPHAVTFVDDVDRYPLERIGRLVEHHAAFPQRTNTEFIQVLAPDELKMRVWERGAGETLACGTGACASVVAGARTGRTGRNATVHLRGGDLLIEWGDDNHVYMTGPAVEVFHGVWQSP